jgi:hypothetical protein
VVAELEARQHLCPHRIVPVARLLQNQRNNLLAFAAELDQQLAELAQDYQVSPALVRELLLLDTVPCHSPVHWQRQAELRHKLGSRYFGLHEAVIQITEQTVRASLDRGASGPSVA